MKWIWIYQTYPQQNSAKKMANRLLKEKLIACANILPDMTSLYRWQGKTCTSKEVIMICKARKSDYLKIEKLVLKHHPYVCPCILSLTIDAAQPGFIKWMKEITDRRPKLKKG